MFPQRTARPIGIAFNSAFFAPIFYHRVRASSMEMEPDDVSFLAFLACGMCAIACVVWKVELYIACYTGLLIC